MSGPVPPSIPALVTGASSGLGEESARQLSARGHDVTLVARRTERLQALAKELRQRHSSKVSVHTADLATHAGRGPVATMLRTKGPWLLVNNAGFGSRGRFAELDAKREVEEVELNVVALHELTAAVIPGNVDARGGAVVNVASTAA